MPPKRRNLCALDSVAWGDICNADAYASALNKVAIVAVTDVRGTIIYANEQFERISKYPLPELIGQNHRILNSGHHTRAFFKEMYQTICRGHIWRGEIKNRAKDGSLYWVDTWIIPAFNEHGKLVGYISIRTDITSRKRAEEELEATNVKLRRQNAEIAHLTYHDTLTGLPNRRLLCDRLRFALEGAPTSAYIAALHIDLDRFKELASTLGYPASDRLLQAMGCRIFGCVDKRDMVARLGRDEFAVIQLAAHPNQIATLASRILKAVEQPLEVGCRELSASARIGIAISPGDGSDPDELLRNANVALQRAKSEGGSYRFFEPEMDRRMQARLELECELRKAFANDQLELRYQPLFNLQRKVVSGFEALLYWYHPKLGRVSPTDFIPIAEEVGLIVPLGEWVLRRACTEAMRWPDQIRVAVNVSAAQLKAENFVGTVRSILEASRLSGSRLELEITESVLLQDEPSTLETLTELRAIGVRISMDDLGTGYSSLASLQSFRFDKIKIDRSFISGLHRSKGAEVILSAIAAIGRGLDIDTTAEGVETEEQLTLVRASGCTEIQGILFSPPCTPSELGRFFSAHSDALTA